MADLQPENRRQHLRFRLKPEGVQDLQQRSTAALAHIDINSETDQFDPTLLGLLGDQSHTGCSVAFLRSQEIASERLVRGDECKVKAGALHPMRAVVRWREDMDEDFCKVGFEFLE